MVKKNNQSFVGDRRHLLNALHAQGVGLEAVFLPEADAGVIVEVDIQEDFFQTA